MNPSESNALDPRTEVFTVVQTLPDIRLDTFLRARYPAVSRGIIQRLIEQGHIQVDGKTVKPTHRPRAGETVRVHWPEPKAAEAQPQEIDLDVIYEDADLLVLNKAPGIVVHPSVGHDDQTLVNALLHHCQGQLSGIGGVARPGIVHRLDKDTSGCLVVAKNDAAHLGLAEQFAGRTMEKTYEAILCGELPRDEGEIHAAIARHPTHRKRMAVATGYGREARTGYRVKERFTGATWVEADLFTGRTHQIRVHFLHVGCPLFGDDIYGKRPTRKLTEQTGIAAPRLMLHARKLAFTHPRTRKKLNLEAPLPEDFQRTLAQLRCKSGA